MKKKKALGYITLVTVIILIPFLLLQGITVVKSSIDMIKASKIFSVRNGILIEKNNCFEETLKFIKNNSEYIGEKTFNINDSTCTATISDTGIDPELGTLKNIFIEVTKDDYTVEFSRIIAVSGKNISVIKN